jgi:hypothetical protein
MKLILSAPIKPSCVIESNKSYHIYYFAEDAWFWNRETVNYWLAQYYSWDTSICKDTARVLRIPWTYHKKWEPFLVKCLWCDPIKYKEKDMITSFPYTHIQPVKPITTMTSQVKRHTSIRDVMWSQSSIRMLERLSWCPLVNWEIISFDTNSDWTDQIIVNNTRTWCRVDKQDYIWSNSKWWPTWVQRCTFYGNSKTQIMDWFITNCSDLIPVWFNEEFRKKERDALYQNEQVQKKDIETKVALKHISSAEKVKRWLDELVNTDPKKIIKWGRESFDNVLWGLYGWKLILVWASTWVWKTTFCNQIALNVSSAWVRVTRYSLEDRLEDNAKEDLFYMTNRIRTSFWKSKIKWIPFVNGEYTHENWKEYDIDIMQDIIDASYIIEDNDIVEIDKTREVWIDDIVELMNVECDKWTKLFIIDHLHYFQFDWTEQRTDLQIENAMKNMNEVARKRNIAIILVAHYKWMVSQWLPDPSFFKWSSWIKQIANTIIQLERDIDWWPTTFHITKHRWIIEDRSEIIANFNKSTFEYDFVKTEEQTTKEKKHRESKIQP